MSQKSSLPQVIQFVSEALMPDSDRQAKPGLGHGYHLHPDGQRVHLRGRGDRLVHAPGIVLAGVDHTGGGILHRGIGGSSDPLRQAGNLQHRSRQLEHR